MDKSMISPCGLDCTNCEIRLARENPDIARRIADWIRENHDPACTDDMIHCIGCPGDRADHWSPDCWILKCCVDQHHLRYCSQCSEFPCEKLEKWAEQQEKYMEALSRLKEFQKELV